MRLFGLIGYPLTHSFSKGYFAEKFEREGISDCRYDNYPLEHIDQFPGLITGNSQLAGLNVTIPYKKQVIAYLDELDTEADRVGAVNTVAFRNQAGITRLKGYNTDVYGFRESIAPYARPHFKKALVLGTGGSSKAVAYVLEGMGMEVTFVSRSPAGSNQISYAAIDRQMIQQNQVVVNASPVGMYPKTNEFPDIPYEFITPGHVLFDLIYNPAETVFMARGRIRGATVINGLSMLYLQAERSWTIWND